jgi:membrane protein
VGAQFADALAVLRGLARAQQAAQVLSVVQVAAAAGLPRDETEMLLERLAGAGWAVKSSSDRWVLACDPERVTVAQVYREFVFQPEALYGVQGDGAQEALLRDLSARLDGALGRSLDMPLKRLLTDSAA